MKNRKSGFTLIELLVVVLIIGILASIAIPQFFKVVEKSKVSEAMSVIAAVKSAQERYLAANGAYAGDFTKLDISYPGMTSAAITTKYYGAAITTHTRDYTLVLTRQTSNSASPYGLYTLTVVVPSQPAPTAANCETGTDCTELVK